MRLRVTGLPAAIALLVLLPLSPIPARAADEPEAVYAKYHRAAATGDLDGMLEHSVAGQRADMKGMSAAHRDAALKMAQAMMPRVFTVERKLLNPDNRATLIVSGPWERGPKGIEPVYGTIQLLTEDGAWKIYGASWTTEKPAILATRAPVPAPRAADKAGKAAIEGKGGAPMVGSMEAATTGRKLGVAKPECVYKPVMTAEDMENCK